MRIAVIGSGYVGLVAGVCFAEIGHHVILVDNDPARVSALKAGEVPIHEKHLPELMEKHRGKGIEFSEDTKAVVRASDVVFIAVGTPPMESGEADLSYVESVARDIASAVGEYKLVVGKSTVPVYTSEWVRKVMLLDGAPHGCFDVASNPEFLREGTAVTDFLYPDRIVVGTDSTHATEMLKAIYEPLTSGTYQKSPTAVQRPAGAPVPARLIVTSARSAELIKHASNSFLALKISFINAVSSICEAVGADVEEVRAGIGSDPRIGSRFLFPGIGYGGSCFPKDVSAFRSVAREFGYEFRLLDEVMQINDDQRQRFIRKVRTALWTLRGKHLGVLGLAFKDGTDDIRESPAIAIVKALMAEGCKVTAYDPAGMKRAAEVLQGPSIEFAETAYDAMRKVDALLVLTEWSEFKTLDLGEMKQLLRYPIVIDGRNLYSPAEMQKHGFIYLSMGRPDVVPQQEVSKFRMATQ